MKMIKAAIASAAILSVSGVAAAQGLAADNRLVRSVTLADLEALAESEGHTVDNATYSGDTPVVIATDAEEGLKFAMFGTACTGTQPNVTCNGINILATWAATPENSDDAKINQLNESKAAVSVFKSGDSIGISRYVILDGGQNMENLKWNLRVFLSISNQMKVEF